MAGEKVLVEDTRRKLRPSTVLHGPLCPSHRTWCLSSAFPPLALSHIMLLSSRPEVPSCMYVIHPPPLQYLSGLMPGKMLHNRSTTVKLSGINEKEVLQLRHH